MLNSMIIHANVTIPTNTVARIGSNVAAVPIARRDPLAHRGRLVREVQLVPREFLVSEVRLVPKVLKALPDPLALRDLSVKLVPSVLRVLPALLGLPVPKVPLV